MARMITLWAVSSNRSGAVVRFGRRVSGTWYGDIMLIGRPIVICFVKLLVAQINILVKFTMKFIVNLDFFFSLE